ncbi:hypothetical protein MCHI_002781 [Candidatus Magnetoovum chiemensis]|nr:hypothetical protein MCHI_002781 [Candidatus Magnetoovum chiemensis]
MFQSSFQVLAPPVPVRAVKPSWMRFNALNSPSAMVTVCLS